MEKLLLCDVITALMTTKTTSLVTSPILTRSFGSFLTTSHCASSYAFLFRGKTRKWRRVRLEERVARCSSRTSPIEECGDNTAPPDFVSKWASTAPPSCIHLGRVFRSPSEP
eukprot:TRINITY_DN13959_c0_g1_i1.p1 TRINITY_DN13959_c0_g1~~TRINITY_DN13959_c0_g1_i1.p1  ORF type:complete len:112 (-),score=9.61 TRINITY_DN13959_c0_g1_i1:632-967(-)